MQRLIKLRTEDDQMTAIPWEAPAALGAGAVLLLSLPRAVRSLRPGRRQRKASDWTRPQRFLAGVLIVLGVGITIPAFTEIYLTVTHLIRPAFGAWSWTVPVSGEIAFTYLFLNGVLLAMRRAPAGALRSMLIAAIIAGSVILNIWAYLGSVPAITGHLIVVAAFFGVLLAGKETVMTLRGGKVRADRITASAWIAHPLHSARLWRWMATWGEPSRAVAHARYMRLLFAITIAQADDRIGSQRRRWRRNLPEILRYQIAMGELPDPPRYGDWQEALAGHVTAQLERLPAAQSGDTDERSDGDTDSDSDERRQDDRERDRRRRNDSDTARDSWPETKDVDPAVLRRMIRTAIGRYEREHDGARVPDAKLEELIQVRMSRVTAKKLLAAAYGAEGARQRAGAR